MSTSATDLADFLSNKRQESNQKLVGEMNEPGNEDVWKVAQELYDIATFSMGQSKEPLNEQNIARQAKYLSESLYSMQTYNFVKDVLDQ